MKKIFLLFSHTLTTRQEKDLKENHGIEEMIYLPPNLQDIWSNVDPEIIEDEKLQEVLDYVIQNSREKDYVLIQGEWGFVYKSINFFKEKNLVPVYSTTKRDVIETTQDDGKILKKSIFEHVKYKKYKY